MTVGGLVVAPDDEVLLIRSWKWKDRFSLPGGKVEWGESLEQAVIREVKEESNLDVVSPRFAFVTQGINSPEYYKSCHFVMNEYIVDLSKTSAKEDVILNEEGDEWVWISPEQALTLLITKETKCVLEWYLKNRP